MPGLNALLLIQEATVERVLTGPDAPARMVRCKRIDGIARWMPAATGRLRCAGWLEPVARGFFAANRSEASDPLTEARGFERHVRAASLVLSGLDEALDEDSARMALLAPDARGLGVAMRGGRIFVRDGRAMREFTLWARRRAQGEGGTGG